LDEWFLYANPAIWAGDGLTQGQGTIFTETGTLLASSSIQAMVRAATGSPVAAGKDLSTFM